MDDFSLGPAFVGEFDVYKLGEEGHGYFWEEYVEIFVEGLCLEVVIIVFVFVHKIKLLTYS